MNEPSISQDRSSAARPSTLPKRCPIRVRLRRNYLALRGEGIATIARDDFNRMPAYQRWVEGAGQDVVVVASLNESTQYG